MLSLLLATSTAWAEPVLLLEGGGTVATLGQDARLLGNGGGAHLGYRLGNVFELVPEFGATVWACDGISVVPDVGARLRIGRVIKPGAYAHVGYLFGNDGGVGWDAGLSLDARALSWLAVGARGGAQVYGGSPAVILGGHLEVSLGRSEAQKERQQRRRDARRDR